MRQTDQPLVTRPSSSVGHRVPALSPSSSSGQGLSPNLQGREGFTSRDQAFLVIATWLDKYHTERPHSALGYLTPKEFAERLAA